VVSTHLHAAKAAVLLAAFAFCGAAGQSASSQTAISPPFPQISGQTLSDQPISLPAAAAGKPAILCIGFSHGSQNHVKNWAEQARKSFAKDSIAVYSIAVLEDAPRFVRPMAIRGMKSGTPPEVRDRFIVVTSKEKELQQAVHSSNSSAAYVVLLDSSGRIAWQYSGDVSDAALAELRNKLSSSR
jgi:ATP10 protein